jgi:DNA ligase (NAD+)
MDRLEQASQEEISEIPGIGPRIAESVHGFFQLDRNRKTIAHLRKVELDLTEPGVSDEPGPLTGKTVVLTGGLRTLSRDQAKDLILRAGGRVSGSVSKKTSYVVVGEEPGSKADDATRLRVPVLDEDAFLKLLGRAS